MFNKTLYFFLAIFLLFTIGIKAQNDCSKINQPHWQWGGGSHWYFGDGVIAKMTANGMDFQPNTNSNTLNHIANEGTATYTDEEGNLKYYTNGRELWDANNNLLNANNPLLAGIQEGTQNVTANGNSAVQGVLFVKHPLNPTTLFIFTVDDELTTSDNVKGLNYFKLNMLTNELSAPIRLGLPDGQFLNFRPTEQLAATFHANEIDIWVMTGVYQTVNNDNNGFFMSFLLKKDGVFIQGVTSQDYGITSIGQLNGRNSRGSIKFSWDGNHMVSVNQTASNHQNSIIYYQFNKNQGTLTNAKHLGAFYNMYGGVKANTFVFDGVYDCEFSPNNNTLYVSGRMSDKEGIDRETVTMSPSIAALDLTQSNPELINQSAKVIVPSSVLDNQSIFTNAVKIGVDGKLYVSNFNDNSNPRHEVLRVSGDLNSPYGSNWLSTSSLLNIEKVQLPPGRKTSLTFSNMFIPHSYNLPQFEIIAEDEVKVCDNSFVLKLKNLCTGEIINSSTNEPLWSGNGITSFTAGTFSPSAAGVGQHIITYNNGGYVLTKTINVINHSTCNQTISDVIASKTCEGCSAFKPIAGKQYFLSAWASHQNVDNPALSKSGFTQMHIQLNFLNSVSTSVGTRDIYPSGQTIDGWKKVEDSFIIPSGTATIDIVFVNNSNADIYFDDLRIHPFEASMVSYVYNNETMQLVAELDDNNFHTKYIYDKEGNIVKMNVETVDGIRTVVETRTHIKK
jgi:hypothetical protein